MAFDLASIQRGRVLKPPRVLLYGVHGIGKSTFGANAPNPVFICTEDGLGSIDTNAFPLASTFAQVEAALTTLINDEHEFETVILDSADWLEAIMAAEIEANYEPKDLAYGKAALILANKWRDVLAMLNALRDRGLAVIVLAHTEIKRFDSPESEPYDRYRPKLQERSNALVQEWADAVLFANYQTIVKKDDVGFNKTVARGISTGRRVIYTQETPAYYAKNRYSLPSYIDLDWQKFADAIVKSAN